MKRLLSALLPLALITVALPAAAQEIVCPKSTRDQEKNKSEARRYFNMGMTFYKMKQFKKSVASFECVLGLIPYSTAARYRLGLSYKGAGNLKKAAEHLKWVIADVSKEAKPIKPKAQAALDEIQKTLDANAAAEKAAAAKRRAEEARLKAEAAEKKRKELEAQRLREAARKKELEQGKKSDLLPTGPNGDAPATKPALTKKWWFWTGVGATALFTAATVGLAFRTLSLNTDYQNSYEDDVKDELFLTRTLTDVALGAAIISGAVLTVAILKYGGGSKAKEPGKKVVVLPACGATGCMINLALDF